MRFCHFLMLSLLVVVTPLVTAQVQVRDADTQRAGGMVQAPQSATGSNELSAAMSGQIEALQQEIQTLRGVVEEQAYQLKRMQVEQKDRYLDIDRRLSGMHPADAKGAAANKSAATPPGQKKAAADHGK